MKKIFPLIIRPRGRFANQMFQIMLASTLAELIKNVNIFGYDIPEWQLTGPKMAKIPGESFLITGHKFNIKNLLYLIDSGMINGVVIEGWGMRLEYFDGPERYRGLFKTNVDYPKLTENDLLIHVRAEDILTGWHPKYFPMPLSYYEEIISVSKLNPIFMGQLGDDPYSVAIRKKFVGAKFLPKLSVVQDFQTLRSAHHVGLSISSFSWLATWLSETVQTINIPLAGLFEPNAETDLLPLNDQRYHFNKLIVPNIQNRNGIELVRWAINN